MPKSINKRKSEKDIIYTRKSIIIIIIIENYYIHKRRFFFLYKVHTQAVFPVAKSDAEAIGL